ncbi:MAG: NTP transferase domain-containing protein [Deferribacterales bacterium]
MISAVVLAAGQSKRLGTDKLLLELDGGSVIDIFLKKLPVSSFSRINLTYHNDKIAETAEKYGINTIYVDNPEAGQGYSIRLGLTDIDTDVMFFAADMPLLKAETIDKLIYNHKKDHITIPVCDGKRRNPVIFPAKAIDALKAIEGDMGGRAVIDSGVFRLNMVEFSDCGQFTDIDDMDDLKRVKELWKRY